jgi:hypothetical protein
LSGEHDRHDPEGQAAKERDEDRLHQVRGHGLQRRIFRNDGATADAPDGLIVDLGAAISTVHGRFPHMD